MPEKNVKSVPPELIQYSVEVEVLIPTTITYKIAATSPQEAMELALRHGTKPESSKPHQSKSRKIKARVLPWRTRLIILTKSF